MPADSYRELLLQKATDAAQRSKWAAEPDVKAAWQRIEADYRMTAASMDVEGTLNCQRPSEQHT
jgi:hypothetical protein